MATVDANIWVAILDTNDVFHSRSVAFLDLASEQGMVIHVPAFALVEVACVVARRFRDPAEGERAAARVAASPLIRIVPLDDVLLEEAMRLGTQRFLRGADALYAATAQMTGTTLVSWDNELVQRAGAQTPAAWLDAGR